MRVDRSAIFDLPFITISLQDAKQIGIHRHICLNVEVALAIGATLNIPAAQDGIRTDLDFFRMTGPFGEGTYNVLELAITLSCP